MTAWQRRVAPIWIAQFLGMMGFSFAMPFIAYFMQEDLGVTDTQQLKIWIALFDSATPLALTVFSPIWGALSDRFGRRIMLLRANFAAAIILTLMGLAQSPLQLILLRLLQGCFTGTMTAAQTMISVQVPENRSGAALGTLSAAVFSGGMVGAALGGVIAHEFGYRTALLLSGWLLVLAGVLIVFGTEEKAGAEELGMEPADVAPEVARGAWAELRPCVPVLVLIGLVAFVRFFDRTFVPLLVQEIHGSLEGVALWGGALAAVGGVAGFLSGMTLGHQADRRSPASVARWTAIGAGLLMIPQAFAHSFGVLFPVRFAQICCSGGIEPVLQIWLARITPSRRRGMAFGWAGTAKSIGWFLAPLVSGAVAAGFGVRAIYLVGAALFLLLVPLIGVIIRRKGGVANGGKP